MTIDTIKPEMIDESGYDRWFDRWQALADLARRIDGNPNDEAECLKTIGKVFFNGFGPADDPAGHAVSRVARALLGNMLPPGDKLKAEPACGAGLEDTCSSGRDCRGKYAP